MLVILFELHSCLCYNLYKFYESPGFLACIKFRNKLNSLRFFLFKFFKSGYLRSYFYNNNMLFLNWNKIVQYFDEIVLKEHKRKTSQQT